MKETKTMTAQELYNEADKYVSRNFNYIQVAVLDKMSDDQLFAKIDQVSEEDHVEDFLADYSLNKEFVLWFTDRNDIFEKVTEKKMLEFVNEEHEQQFDIYKEEQEQKNYPMWNTCFEFRHEPSEDEINAAVKAGFGIIRDVDGFNTLLFVAGCGYSFFGAHWIPMIIELNLYGDTKEAAKGVDYSMM